MNIQKVVGDLEVVRNIRLNSRHFILELQAPDPLPLMLPGQFVQVLVADSPATFLRRPFSIHSIDLQGNSFRLLIQIKGEGTRHLSHLQEREKVNVLYPLGKSFSLPSTNQVLLVGGGCGAAPLLFLAQFLHQNKIHPAILLGFRTKEDIAELDEYSRFGQVMLITDDGSEGEKGLIPEHSVFRQGLRGFKKVYCCGPEAMMRSVAKIAASHQVDCEVSLENTMACGFGVCLCCVTPTDLGNERVCVEGPVFNTRRLKWT